MTKYLGFCLLLGVCLPMAAIAGPTSVAEADRDEWWIWANPPAVNLAAEQAVSRKEGDPPLEVRFRYTIDSKGGVADCEVAYRSEAVYDEATLCALIALHQYRPAPGNSSRVEIRTAQTLLIGVPPEQARTLVGDQRHP